MSSVIISIFIFLSVSLPLLVTSKGGFSTDLIHRDSPQSPFYDPTLTPSDRLRASIHRSISRFNQISTEDIQSTITPAGAEYLMSVDIGTPPFNVMAIADTGSDLTWTQCQPCVSCYKQKAPIYDSSKSSTYTSLSCNAQSCSQLPSSDCGSSNDCQYTYTYGDQSHTRGVLSSESFSIGSASIPKILFGCSHDSNGTFDSNSAGIVGLGGGPLSLVSQLGTSISSKFSYCLVPSESKATSKINFGDNADVGPQELVTPLVKGESITYYTVTLESVSVAGGEKIAVAAKAADDYGQEGNIIVDSGTTLTILDDSVLNRLANDISKIVTYPTTQDPQGLFPLCYDVSGVNRDTVSFPDMTFQFTGAALTLKPLNTFVEAEDNVICLAMASSTQLGGGIQIFGNIAQQNFHVGYDLKNQKLSFAPADCSKF